MWLSGMRNVVAIGLSTPIWCRTRFRSGVVAGSISQTTSKAGGGHRPAHAEALGEADVADGQRPARRRPRGRAPIRSTRRGPTASGWRSPVAELQRRSGPGRGPRPPAAAMSARLDAPASPGRGRPRGAGPRRAPGRTLRTPTPPTGGPAASPRAGHEEGPAGRVEHGGGEAQLAVVEAAVALDELRLGPRHDPAGAVAVVRLGGQRDARRKGGRGTECIPSILSEMAGAPVPGAPRHPSPVFSPVPPDIDFVALEQAELARWAAHRVFERSVEQREGAPPWVFYEGPPTANGMPGLHHVWARVYKDLFCRFRTMDGAYVARRAGWDTHGLPVEVEVEKKLGITGKQQIEDAGRHRRVHPAVPRVGLLLRRRVRPPDHAHRLLGRHGRGLLDARPVATSSRSGGTSSSSSTRDCSTRTSRSCPTARAAARRCRATSWASPTSTATRRTSRPTCGCACVDPDTRRRRRRRVAGGVDDHAVDAAVEHRRGGEPRADLRRRRRDVGGRRAGRRR